jgi:ABC-type sugar transport system substrate-binding protein
MWTTKSGLLWRLVAVLLAFTLIAAACGDDDDAAEPAPEPAAEPAEEPAAEPAEEPSDDPLVVAALSAAGDPVEVPQIHAGYLQWIYADEAGKRIEDAAKEAIEFLGWEFTTCDAGGDPAQMPICGNQLLDQDVDVIFTDGIPEAFITDVLEQAEAAGIPVISAGGEVDPRDIYVASYASDDTDLGVQLAEYLKAQLPDGGNIIVQTFPAAWSVKRQAGLASAIEGSNITIVDTWEADPTNMVEGTAAEVTTKLAQFDVDGIWIDFSVASIGASNAIGALYPDGDEPDRPLLMTFYANPTSVEDIRSGRLDAAVDEKLEWQSWAQADAIAQLLARGTAPSQERAPDFGGLNFSSRQVVTIDNIPATGTEIAPPDPGDYEVFFRTKWCEEFTNVPNC